MEHHDCDARGARLEQFDEPHWEPIVTAVGEHLAGGFMWMQEARLSDGTPLHGYKHIFTRRYLYLDNHVGAYAPTACGQYHRIRLDYAIERALCSWWLLSGWEEADRQAIVDAIQRMPEEEHHDPLVDQLFT